MKTPKTLTNSPIRPNLEFYLTEIMKQWEKIYSTTDLLRAELVKSTMELNEIPAIILNKQDSSYNNFGEREVYVNKKDLVKALAIIENEIEFE
jgi:hypothetical protein